MGLSPRAAGLSRAAAQSRWRGTHARLFARVQGLVSYVQNHAVLDERDTPLLGDPGFDIFSEVEFASAASMREAAASDYYRSTIISDEQGLLDASRRAFLMTRRVVLWGSLGDGAIKLVRFLPEGVGLDEVARRPRSTGAEAEWAYEVEELHGWERPPVGLVLQTRFATVEAALAAAAERPRREAAIVPVIVRNVVVRAATQTVI